MPWSATALQLLIQGAHLKGRLRALDLVLDSIVRELGFRNGTPCHPLFRERTRMKPHIRNARLGVLRLLRFASLVIVALAILSSGATAAQWSTTDLKTGAPLPTGTATVNGVSVRWQVGNYYSGNLRIYGILCAPTAAGPHPVAILNHGLHLNGTTVDPAILPYSLDGCRQMAAKGWIAAMSTYRGETISIPNFAATSDGTIELCNGEVDDVLHLLSAVTALPGAHAQKVLMLGYSHGSCITERAIERGAQVKIAVSIDGPTDFITWPNSPPLTGQEKAARSSANSMNNPAALTGVRFLRVQAAGDPVVPPEQACELALQIRSRNYFMDSSATPPRVTQPNLALLAGPLQSACLTPEMRWLSPPRIWRSCPHRPCWRRRWYWSSPLLAMYTGLDHVSILFAAWPLTVNFVNHFARGWNASLPANFVPFG